MKMELNNKGIGQQIMAFIVVVVVVAIVAVAGTYFFVGGAAEEEEEQWTEYPNPNKINLKEETPTVAGVFIGLNNPWGELNRKAFKWYCGEVLGWNYEIVWPDLSVSKQNDQVESLIKEDKIDAILVDPLSRLGNAKIGEMAKEAGIPVVLFANDMKNTWPLAMFQRNGSLSGQKCGEHLVQAMKDKYGKVEGKILQIHGNRGTNSDYLRSSGFWSAIEPYRENLNVIEVGNSWVVSKEYPKIKAALQANPDIKAVYEEMGGFHSAVVDAAEELGWSDQKIKDLICVNVDTFPVNVQAFKEGTQDYARMMPTGGYMMAPALELLREYWQCSTKAEVENVLPEIGDTYTVEKYAPEMKMNATVNGFKPLQWFNDPEYGVAPTDIKPAPAGGTDTPWVLISDRVVTEANCDEDFIYWNWPIWGLSE